MSLINTITMKEIILLKYGGIFLLGALGDRLIRIYNRDGPKLEQIKSIIELIGSILLLVLNKLTSKYRDERKRGLIVVKVLSRREIT